MKKVKIRICKTAEEAQFLSDDLLADAEDENGGLWALGVSYTQDDGVERTLFAALEYDGTPAGAVMSAVHLLSSLGTLRIAVDSLMKELAAEAYLDDETLELLTAREIEAVLSEQEYDSYSQET